MTTLPGSGQLSLLQVRNHLGGTGEVTLPDDLYRGQLVPDVQQFTGNGFRSNTTGAHFQVLRYSSMTVSIQDHRRVFTLSTLIQLVLSLKIVLIVQLYRLTLMR